MTSHDGAETTAQEAIQGIDLSGRNAFVTGASGGLGAETARVLAGAGAAVTLAARDLEKAEGVAAEIRTSTGNDQVSVTPLELTDLQSVRACAQTWIASKQPLHLLINNAGLMACPLQRTPAGYESQLATNHIGHFLLTCLLVPALKLDPPARIINLSSAGHRFSGLHFEDPHYEKRDYDKWEAYGQSKTANILFSVELDRRLSPQGIRALSVHPGMIMTELGRHLGPSDIKELMSRTPRRQGEGGGGPSWKTVEQGAATSVWAATSPDLAGRGGLYCLDCRVVEPGGDENDMNGVSDYALDEAAARKLWTLSEKWVEDRFDLT